MPANANGGKYVIEVKAENGSKKNYVLEFREKSDDTSIKSITTEKGLDGEYNVDMSMTVLYEANVPDHDTLLDILLTDKYATIESIHEVALPDDSENIIDSTGDIITRKKTDEGAFRYKVVGGVPIGGKRQSWLRTTTYY